MFEMYSKYSKVDVAKAIDLELKGDIENLLVAVGKILQALYVDGTKFMSKSWGCCFCNRFLETKGCMGNGHTLIV